MNNQDAIKAFKPWYEYLKVNHNFMVDIDLVTVATLLECEKEEIRAELEALDTPKESHKEEAKKPKTVTYEEAIKRMRPVVLGALIRHCPDEAATVASVLFDIFDFEETKENIDKVYHDLRGW